MLDGSLLLVRNSSLTTSDGGEACAGTSGWSSGRDGPARARGAKSSWTGQGRSGDDRTPASAAHYADLLAGFVHALRLDEWVVLIDPGGLDEVGALARFVTRRMAAFFAAGARGARWFPWAFRRYYGLVLPGPAARAQRERIIAAAPKSAPILVQAWRSIGEPSADSRELAASLSCPVLVAWAKRDRIIQLRRNRPAIARIPHARLELFAGGHSPFLECPDEFERSLEAFLAEVWRR